MPSVSAPAGSPALVALRSPGVARLLALSMVARTPEAVLSLLFLLRARDMDGSYALAGLVAGVTGLGVAVGSPVLGRLVDRVGQPLVLAVGVVVASAAMATAALLPSTTPASVLLPLALASGAAQPPVAACLRALFRRIVPDPGARHAALALEASVQELTFMLGPLVFVSLVATHDPALALGLAAGTMLVATLVFAASPEPRAMPATGVRRSAAAGPMRRPAIRLLLVVSIGLGVMFGANEVAITGAAEDAGDPGAVGLLLAAYCLGSLIAGLVVAHRGAGPSPVRSLLVLLVLCTAGHALPVVAPDLVVLGAVLLLAGAAIAPLFTVVASLCGLLAAEGTTTEAFTWLGSGLYAGAAAGAGVAGVLVDVAGPGAAFAAAAASIGLAGSVVVPWRGALRPTGDGGVVATPGPAPASGTTGPDPAGPTSRGSGPRR